METRDIKTRNEKVKNIVELIKALMAKGYTLEEAKEIVYHVNEEK